MRPASLQAIAVTIEQDHGNVEPLLHEIRHAVALLLAEGTSSCIDLKALPLTPGEERRILTLLGRGEVRAEVEVLGSTEVTETSYPGVWLVSHLDERGEPQARFIEITHIPEILRSQAEDIRAGLERLTARLSPRNHPEEPDAKP
jgi:hydrogenase-1 operon protein HyaF